MNRRNLLPPHRIAAKRRVRATRRWAVVDAAYAAVLLVAGVAYYFGSAAGPATPAAPATTVDVAKLNTTLVGLRQQAAALTADLRSVQDAADRPDWSYLLAGLADSLGDDAVLGGVDAPADAADALPRRVTLTGIGRSQAAVTQCALRLESLRVFSKVTIAQTSAQSLRGVDGVGFQIVCTLPDGGRGP